MAYIYERIIKNHKYYYLKKRIGKRVVDLAYLGTKCPIAKSRGWENLSPEVEAWLIERAKQKTKPVPIEKIQNGRYRTIVVDPPWPMERVEMIARTSELPFDYPTMTLNQIMNDRKHLPIRRLVDKSGCLIFLWTTQKFLLAAFDAIETWGFRYLFTMVWAKGRGRQLVGLPQFNCEFVLVARIGKLNFLETKAFKTLFEGKARNHSQKPKEFYRLLKRITPEPRIDMFSREKHRGFDQFGNETNKFNAGEYGTDTN